MLSVQWRGLDKAIRGLDRMRGRVGPEVGDVLAKTVRDIGVRFSRTAPIGRTGQLYRSARFKRVKGGGSLRLVVRHGKPSEANKPAFNNAIKHSMKGIRGRIRKAVRTAKG